VALYSVNNLGELLDDSREPVGHQCDLFQGLAQSDIQNVPPEYEHLDIGRIKLHSSMTII
jgi:hypothetical protein